jgi:DNA-binding transcriptional LysR family regulator
MIRELRHLRAFLTVARVGSFTQAARVLHLSQPALTVQIKQLEAALRVRLFDRDSHKVRLTAVGRQLAPAFERVLADLDVASNAATEWAGGETGVVAVGCLRSVAANIVPTAIARFKDAYPKVRVRILDDVDQRIAAMVSNGDVDFGLATSEYVDANVVFESLIVDHAVAVMPKQHPLARAGRLPLRRLAKHPLILTETGLRKAIEHAFASIGETIAPAYETQYVPSVLALVRAGLGVAILPFMMADGNSIGDLVCRRIAHRDLHRRVGLVTRGGISQAPAAQRFIAAVRDVFREIRHERAG